MKIVNTGFDFHNNLMSHDQFCHSYRNCESKIYDCDSEVRKVNCSVILPLHYKMYEFVQSFDFCFR